MRSTFAKKSRVKHDDEFPTDLSISSNALITCPFDIHTVPLDDTYML